MATVLHITAHMGGGVGKTLSRVTAYAKKKQNKFQHSIVCLEHPEKLQYIDFAKNNGIPVHIAPTERELNALVDNADIVQIEWWHHPLMASWLNFFRFPSVRLIIWCHISGHYPPVIPQGLLIIPEFFIFTTPYSYESPYLRDINWDKLADRVGVVFGSGGFEDFSSLNPAAHDGFNVGYVGTLDFSKLHPDYIKFCAAAKLPDARFIMAGDESTRHELEQQANSEGILNQLEFVGYTNDVAAELARFDVFGYPLNPEHFGASENALLEAMAAGITPVVLDQAAEKHIVRHMETGILVKNPLEYGQALRYLYAHPEERERMGKNARQYVLKQFSVGQIVKQLDNYYEALLRCNKKEVSFSGLFGNTPAEWFLSCLGNDRVMFERSMQCVNDLEQTADVAADIKNCREILKGKTKSSVHHFKKYFPEDKWLNYWADLLTVNKEIKLHALSK